MKSDHNLDAKKTCPSPNLSGDGIKGCDVLVKALEKQSVDTVFAYPGGASMELHQALMRSTKIRTILPRFEQGGGFMAHGYARATGRVGVCMATSGPGATNLITCIADAFMDSIPLVAITGQVYQNLIGKSAFQETDFFGMTLPVVKHSYLVLNAEDLPRVVAEAFYIAKQGRPGPVVIDIPKDVQQKVFTPDYEQNMDLPGIPADPVASNEALNKVVRLIEQSTQPVLYIGGGVISAEAVSELREFAEITGLPVASTLMGLGAFPAKHFQSLYWFGMHGTVAGNFAVYESDLLICAGARFDDRITGAVEKFAPKAKIVHFDIDHSEHQKNKFAHYPIQSDIKDALVKLIDRVKQASFKKPNLGEWFSTIKGWKAEHPFPFVYKPSKYILPQDAIKALYEETKGEAIITTGVGQHQMWAAQYYQFNEPRTYISSLGLGTMGFGYPAAVGAKVAFPDKCVVDIDGDGSFLMNIQEMATAKIEKIGAKCLMINNQHLGMVVQWEDRFYKGVRAHTILGDPENIGGPDNLEAIYPDYVTLAKGFGIQAWRVHKKEDLVEAVREFVAYEGPCLLDVIVPYSEHVLPMIPQSKSALEIITE